VSELISGVIISATATAVVDFNWRDVTQDGVIYIKSTINLSVGITDGVGGQDPAQVTAACPYVLGGSSIPIYATTPSLYSVPANTVHNIAFIRDQLGDWLKITISNLDATSGTVSIYGTIS
jgi:hypothetical protein